MINVFLDDKRRAPKGFRIVRSAAECIELLQTQQIQILSLDYNLGGNKPTGYTVAKHMVRHKLFPKKIIIHSHSPHGRMQMYRVLCRHAPKRIPILIRLSEGSV
ncbi:cyclic-phosphate processing receiver domain-containing protein [Paenibacillus xerothermodurans]|uniref:Cell division protein FtsJ n=1 Tax=Paenibacillus xerothermodurans TaxID=1977292 RepID=A0A2W1NRW2_PAEXE|nr:cyclic-phosphate processing receiver domain-containing protein [Paenibacillus xerothermodurans]PZE21583.1 cell division protein FtsJ [Paenibacillus xerothermodurans]